MQLLGVVLKVVAEGHMINSILDTAAAADMLMIVPAVKRRKVINLQI